MGALLFLITLTWSMTMLEDAAARTSTLGTLPEGVLAMRAWGTLVFTLHILLSHVAVISSACPCYRAECCRPGKDGWLWV